jgi:Zn-dependent protease
MAPPPIVAVVLHEVAHGLMAEKLGDPTARKLKRITLNPIKHIDLFLTIILPLLLIISKSGIVFGGAKPVPVNPIYFKDPRKGMLWVALAGPVTNFILAILFYIVLNFIEPLKFSTPPAVIIHNLLIIWCAYSIIINVVLGTFNLMPIPPLDGGRIVVGILPKKLAYKYAKLERFGFIIVIFLIYYGIPQAVLEPLIKWVMTKL